MPRLQTKPLNLVDMLAGPDESDEEADEKRSFDLGKLKKGKQITEIQNLCAFVKIYVAQLRAVEVDIFIFSLDKLKLFMQYM